MGGQNNVTVLIAGLVASENQFSRAVSKYGCTVLHTDADSKGFPHNADVVIAVRTYLNKVKFENIKEYYHNTGKRVFTATHGFSEIKEAFEAVLFERAAQSPTPFERREPTYARPYGKSQQRDVQVIRKPRRTFNSPFNDLNDKLKAPVQEEPPQPQPLSPSIELEEVVPEATPPPAPTRRYDIEEIYKVVKECQDAGLSISDTIEMLASEGLERKAGGPFLASDINNYRAGLKKRALLPDAQVAEKPNASAQTKPEETPVATPTASPRRKNTSKQAFPPMQLVAAVLKSKAPEQEKLRLIAEIHEGKILYPAVTTQRVEDGRIIFTKFMLDTAEDKIVVAFTKAQAQVAFEQVEAIEDFLTKP